MQACAAGQRVAISDRHRIIINFVAHQCLRVHSAAGLITGIKRCRWQVHHRLEIMHQALPDVSWRPPSSTTVEGEVERDIASAFAQCRIWWNLCPDASYCCCFLVAVKAANRTKGADRRNARLRNMMRYFLRYHHRITNLLQLISYS
jgi:hypothetical protein